MKPWMAIVAVAATAGCGGMQQTHISDAQLAHKASASERTRLQAQEQRVTVAEKEAAAARRAVDQAKEFRHIAKRENDGALAELDAATQARALGDDAHDANLRALALEHERNTRRKVAATEALTGYAARLVALRQAKVDAADAETNLARADVESLKAHIVAKGEPGDLGLRARKSRDVAVDQLRDARLKVQEAQSQAQAARDLWLQRRSALTAARGMDLLPLFAPPPAPRVPEAE